MKQNKGLFSEGFWLPVFGVASVIFLALSIYGGYLVWQNTNKDAENLQKIQELQTLTRNVLFFSENTAKGDASAIDPLIDTVDAVENTVNFLLEADDFTKENLAEEYESMVNLWRSIQNNTAILSEVEYALVLIRAVADKLDTAASEAQRISISSIEKLAQQKNQNTQITLLSAQSVLLRDMADEMQEFTTELRPTSKAFDSYRFSFSAFEVGHGTLLSGDASRDILPIKDEEIIADIEDIFSLVEGVQVADTYIINAVEALLQARDAQSKVASSFDGLQVTLASMRLQISELGDQRFPQAWHVLLVIAAFAISIIGFMVAQKQTSKQMLEYEQSENENVQAAILRLLDELADLADGDLTVTTTVSEDFTGAIADSVNYTIDQLRQLVSRINNTAVQVSGAAQDSQQTALHLAEASDHQAQEIAGASAAINEMAVTIDQVSANAAESALVANKSVSIANNGAKLVQNTIHGMDTIREQIQDTSKRIKRLGESSQEIGDIVSLINDIADQTNILALNAAIQASMAGDAGRGFAVVADEVQRLAERSAAATKQIETLVKTIQSDTNEAVTSMEQTTTEVVSGARLAQNAGVALEEIEGVSANIAELIQNISNAARQQASSAGHISNTMNVIQEITSQTSAGTGATAQAIGDLADMALELRESVAGFKLPEEMGLDPEVDLDSDAWLSADSIDEVSSESDEQQMDNLLADTGTEEADINEMLDIGGLDVEEEASFLEEMDAVGSEDEFDYSDEMLSLAESEGVDLMDDEFDLSDFDFADETETDKVS